MHTIRSLDGSTMEEMLFPPFRKVEFQKDLAQVVFSSQLRHAWMASLGQATTSGPVGQFIKANHEPTEEERALVPQNPDKDAIHTDWRDEVYQFWNHLFVNVSNFLGCGIGHFHPPSHDVLPLGYADQALGKEPDTDILVIPTYLDSGIKTSITIDRRYDIAIIVSHPVNAHQGFNLILDMSALEILICGAGIAGPTLALLLSRSSTRHRITIVERAPELRTTGQQVDLRRSGITIMQRLGLLDNLKAITTEETGIAFVDSDNTVKAKYPVEKGGNTQSFSSEYEILRGKYAELLYDKTKDAPNLNYIFGDRVESVEQQDDRVRVVFKYGTPTTSYDLVVAADGQNSRTRDIAWAQSSNVTTQEVSSPLKSLDQYMAYFSIPISDGDLKTAGSGLARWYNVPRRRSIFVRPDHRGRQRSSAYLAIMVPPRTPGESTTSARNEGSESKGQTVRQRLDAAIYNHGDIASQKALFRELFADAGWEIDRVLDGMDKSDDFYMQEIAQVKLSPSQGKPGLAWSRGRVVCLGDAGYCPTPIAGVGTTLAVIGAYVLAGELSKSVVSNSGNPIESALHKYEEIFRPYVDNAQKIAPGAPGIMNPDTAWGIRVMHGVLGLAARTGMAKLAMKLTPSTSKETFQFPQYEELNIPA